MDISELCKENITTRSDFRKWARIHHPDKPSGSQEVFSKISALVSNILPTNGDKINCVDVDPSKAKCIRRTENWTKIQKHHRFDKPSFNPTQFLTDMKTMSPKLEKLLTNIRELDTNDFNRHEKYFKHFIFSDVKDGGCGAKIIASALSAHGFTSCFVPSTPFRIKIPNSHPKHETFGVLSSTAIYNTTFSKKHVKDLLTMFNERPLNIHGERIRFIILDSGFKEGIDLFDVKYVHIFEHQRNKADLTQAVGRATRSCGQKGLDFVHNTGWKLHVYQYNSIYPNNTFVFDDYLAYAGVDLNQHVFTDNLERLAIETAVDHDLNIEINKYEAKHDNALLELTYTGGNTKLGCNGGKCGSRSTKQIPFSLTLLRKVYKKKLPKDYRKLPTKDKRKIFCDELVNNQEYCIQVNERYNNNLSMKKDLNTLKTKSFKEFQKHINKIFKKYKYKPIKVQNECNMSASNIVKFTPSQEFITNYFVPEHFAKGLLVWHSVGTGKTCTAISVKSFLFEKMDYSIIYVTRTTLKEDIWKNMYETVCDHIIREKLKDGYDVSKLKHHLSKKFLPPMSYKQFSNTLEGKNDLYNRLVSINGTQDILKKTLVIIDEAHKLYSKDLVALEKPNMKIIEDVVGRSTSCKVLLMTGTPIADDPMEFLKLMNLIKENNKFPVEYHEFAKEFLSNNEFTEKGKELFQKHTKGLISYLNRRYDPRQFAQPVFYQMNVPVSEPPKHDECNNTSEEKYQKCLQKIKQPDESNVNALTNEIQKLTHEIEDFKADLKLDKLNVQLKDLINLKQNNLKNLKVLLKQAKTTLRQDVKLAKEAASKCKTELKHENKNCKDKQQEQQYLYQRTALEHC